MMEGRGPFYVLVAQMVRAEEPLPESERILDMWEFRTAFGGAKCFYSVLVENRITKPRMGTYCSVFLAGIFVKICVFIIFAGLLLRALSGRWYRRSERALSALSMFC